MGVYIKDMEMPKNCGRCFLRVGQCSKRIYMENRPLDCPLIEIPEPHGRLGDLDALKGSIMFAKETAKWSVPLLRTVLMIVDKMPTVISASEEE